MVAGVASGSGNFLRRALGVTSSDRWPTLKTRGRGRHLSL